MTKPTRARILGGMAAIAAIALLYTAAPAWARQAPAAGPQAGVPAAPGARVQPPPPAEDTDAQEIREELIQLLRKHPPSLGKVMRLDPSLMGNDAFLAPYPAVAAFLARHPEIARNPSYFLDRIGLADPSDSAAEAAAWRRTRSMEILNGLVAFVVFIIMVGVVIWLIKTTIESRRWSHVSKTHADVHTRLLERFSSNEDLLAYIQTPVGRRFLEAGPAPLADEPRSLSAPISRILWSVQVGSVLTIGSGGLLFVSRRLDAEFAMFVVALGMVMLALGAGFLVASLAAYLVTRRMGLLEPHDSPRA
jgi:hypothetical protein